jgi:hypothetical protein
MPSSKTVALSFLLCSVSVDVKAETAFEVQSWCKEIVNAKFRPDHMISYRQNHDTGFCWGAFGMMQELSVFVRDDGTRMLGFCPPKDSTRVQLIKIFSKFVDDHLAMVGQDFGVVAEQALAAAFPCSEATPSR